MPHTAVARSPLAASRAPSAHFRRAAIPLMAALLCAPAAFAAPGDPFRPPVVADSGTTVAAREPDLAMDADGDFVVVWEQYLTGIRAQRYNANGTAQGSQVVVTTVSTAQAPAVGMDAVGNFVVTWYSRPPSGSSYVVNARRFNAVGTARGNAFAVTLEAAGARSHDVAMEDDGDFVVVWQREASGQALRDQDIRARRYNASGIAQGTEIQVSEFPDVMPTRQARGLDPAIALLPDGGFVVAWTAAVFEIVDQNIRARVFGSDGLPQGDEFRAAAPRDPNATFEGGASVAANSSGEFVITWTEGPLDLEDDGFDSNNDLAISARRFNALGTAIGARLNVATVVEGFGHTFGGVFDAPSVAMDDDGEFVVAWQFDDEADLNHLQILARRYGAADNPVGELLTVNTNPDDGSNGSPTALAIQADGDFFATWSTSNATADGHVYVRGFEDQGGPAPVPTVSFNRSSLTLTEGEGFVLRLMLSQPTTVAVNVPLSLVSGTATAGVDVSLLTAGTVVIPAGATTAAVRLGSVDDALDELAVERFTLQIGTPSDASLGTPSQFAGALRDNDAPPTAAFSAALSSGAENLRRIAIVELSEPSGLVVRVPFTISGNAALGDDYILSRTPPLVFRPGVTSVSLHIDGIDDALDEPVENVILTLGTPTNAGLGATVQHTRRLVDND